MSMSLNRGDEVESCVIAERLSGSSNATAYLAEFSPGKAATRLRREMRQTKNQAELSLLRKRLKFILTKKEQTVFLKQYSNPGYRDTELIRNYVRYQQKIHSRINACGQNDLLCCEYDSFICEEPGKRAYYQALEYFEFNQPLTELINGSPVTVVKPQRPQLRFDEMLFHAKQLFYAINILHELEIVHADLKPDNLLILPNNIKCDYQTMLRLIDFDASIIVGEDHPRYLQFREKHPGETYHHRGTAGYVSPEHFNGEVPCYASDVFTASVIAFEMLSRSGHPFPFIKEDYRTAVRKGKFRFSEMKGPLSRTAVEALKAGLSYKKEQRPTAFDLLEALRS